MNNRIHDGADAQSFFTSILLDVIYCCIVKWYTPIVSQYGDLVKQGAEFNQIILHGIALHCNDYIIIIFAFDMFWFGSVKII